MSIMYLGLVLIFPTKLYPDPSTLSVFQDFRFPSPDSPPPSISPDPVGIENNSSETRYPSKHQILLRSDQPFLS